MDSKIKTKSIFEQQLHDIEKDGAPADKRLAMYKNLRDQMLDSLKSDQQSEHRMRMAELDKQIQLLEISTREREARIKLMQKEEEVHRAGENKGFLDGIKSYKVEDI